MNRERRLAEISMRYGSRAVPPWYVHELVDGRGYTVTSAGGNEIIAIKHYSPTIAASVADVIEHCHEDIGFLLGEVARVDDSTERARTLVEWRTFCAELMELAEMCEDTLIARSVLLEYRARFSALSDTPIAEQPLA